MNDHKDIELVLRIQANNIEAFNTLYWRYHQALYFNILKLLKDTDASQDILQDVFITLWEKRAGIDLDQPISNWLFRVSYNKSISYFKKSLKQSEINFKLNREVQLVEEQEINFKEVQFTLLEKAINQLSPQKKRVFERCKIQGKSYDETAKELGISKYTVKEYLSDAIIYIKQYIKQHPDYLIVFIVATFLTMFIL